MNKRFWARLQALAFFMSFGLQVNAVAESATTQPADITSLEIINLLESGMPMEIKPELTPEQIKEEEEKVNLEIPKLTPRQTLDSYTQLYKAEKVGNSVATATSTCMRDIIRDLELFRSQDQHNLLSAFDHTSTTTGCIELARMLTHPESNREILIACQNFIKELVGNQKLFNYVQSLVSKFDESTFLSLWQKQNKPTEDVINAAYPLSYFANWSAVKALHKNTATMETSVRLGNVGTCYSLSLFPVLLPMGLCDFFRPFLIQEQDANISNCKEGQEYYKWLGKEVPKDLQLALAKAEEKRAGFYPDSSRLSAAAHMYKDGVSYAAKSVVDGSVKKIVQNVYKGYQESKDPYKHWQVLGAAAYVTLISGTYLYVNKKIVDSSLQIKDTINHLQTKLISAGDLVNSLKAAYELGKKDRIFANGFAPYKQLCTFFERQTDIVQRLQSNTFTGQASFFSLSGRVLSTYAVMKEAKDDLLPAVKMLGQLDACLSIAKLIKETQNDRVGYCFVDYVADTKPCLHLEDFWNPMVPKDAVVTNSVAFGGNQERRGMIVTGSNTGGKSTALKGVTISVLLAHTLGIAPAKSMQVTPFAYIGSSMNIADNTFSGDSLYKAEVKRAHGIINALGSLNDKFGYVVIDELFRGTSPDQAEQGTGKCVNRLMANSNSICIFATHFKQHIKELEEQSNGAWNNYKVDVIKNADGSITRPYKLEPGIGSVDVAMSLLDDGF